MHNRIVLLEGDDSRMESEKIADIIFFCMGNLAVSANLSHAVQKACHIGRGWRYSIEPSIQNNVFFKK